MCIEREIKEHSFLRCHNIYNLYCTSSESLKTSQRFFKMVTVVINNALIKLQLN